MTRGPLQVAILALVLSVFLCDFGTGADSGVGPLPIRWRALSTTELVHRLRSISYNWRYFDYYLSLSDEVAKRGDAADPLLASVQTLRMRPAAVFEAHLAALAQLKDPRTPAVVAPLLFHADDSVRRSAAETLASCGPAGTERLLAAIPELRPTSRVAALRALQEADDRANDVLYTYLAGGTGHEREAVCDVLGRRGDRDAAPPLRKLLESHGPRLQQAAVGALGELRDPVAVPRLITLLATDDATSWPLADKAAAALGKIGDRKAVPHLIDVLLRVAPHERQNTATRAAAARALGLIGDASATPALLQALEAELAEADGAGRGAPGDGGPGPPVLLPAITDALQRLAAGSMDRLAAALDTPIRSVRTHVAQVLAQSAREATDPATRSRAIRLLEKAVRDEPDPVDYGLLRALLDIDPRNVRALRALGALLEGRESGPYQGVAEAWAGGGAEMLPQLIQWSRDGSRLTRLAAALALAEINAPLGVDAVREFLNNSEQNYSLQTPLTQFLARHDRPAVRACLLQQAQRDTIWGGAYSAAALAQTGDPRARLILVACLKHPLGYVPGVAARGLATLNDAESLAALAGYLKLHPAAVDWAWFKQFDEATVDDVLPEILAHVTARREESRMQLLLPGLVPALERTLQDARPMVRRNAAFLLGEAGMRRSVTPLMKLLNDTAAGGEAAEALGKIGDSQAVAGLIAYQIRSVENPDVARWLAMIGEPAVPALILALEQPLTDAALRRLAEALELIPDPRALTALTNLVESKRIGIAALGAIADPRSAELLAGLTASQRGVLGQEAYDGLVQIGPPAVLALRAELARHKADPPPLVLLALGVIGTRDSVPALLDRLARSDGAKVHVIDALGRIGDAAAVRAIAAILLDRQSSAAERLAAANALGAIGLAEVRGPLEAAAKDANPEQKRHLETLLSVVP